MSACSILLVSANRHTSPYPVYPLGLSYLKTYLERTISGIRVDMADCNLLTDGQLAERIRMLAPRYIGLSLRNVDGANSLDRRGFLPQYRALADVIRAASDAPLIIGGAGFSISPEAFMRELGADYGIHGEGEGPLAELIGALERGRTEIDIAEDVLARAQSGKGARRHVGWFLLREVLGAPEKRGDGAWYIAAVIVGTLALSLLLGFATGSVSGAVLLLIPVSEVVKGLLDAVLLRVTKPRFVPRLALRRGIPPEGRTLCVIAALLTCPGDAHALTARLEEYYLCNRDAGEQLERLSVVAHAGGVRGVIENDGLRARRDGSAQALFADGIVLLGVGRHIDAHAARQLDLRAVQREIRGENNDLVARVKDGKHCQRHAEAARRAHEHVVARKALVEVLFPRLADRGNELRVALGVAVVSVAGLGVAEGRVDDGLVGRKVRVADAQVDNVLVFGQRRGVERQAGARALEALGNKVSLHG